LVVVVNFICDCAIGGGCQLTTSCYVADFAAMDRNSSSQGSSIEEIGTECPMPAIKLVTSRLRENNLGCEKKIC
jgi:hypothetical protein